MTNGVALAAHFGDGVVRADDVAAGLVGAIVKDPVQDRIVWQEYLETVVKDRRDWSDLYRACRELASDRRDPRRAAPRPGLGSDRARRPGGARPGPDRHRGAAGARCPRPACRRPETSSRPWRGLSTPWTHRGCRRSTPSPSSPPSGSRCAGPSSARGHRGLCRPACDQRAGPVAGAGSGSSRSGRPASTRSPCCPGPRRLRRSRAVVGGRHRAPAVIESRAVPAAGDRDGGGPGDPTDATTTSRTRGARPPCARSSARHSGTGPSASPSSAGPITPPRSTRRRSPPSAATTRCSPSCPRSRSPQPGCRGRRPGSPTPRATGPACARRAGTGTCSSRRRSPSCRRGSSGWPAPYATSASTPRPRRSSRPPGSRRRWPRSGAGPRSG